MTAKIEAVRCKDCGGKIDKQSRRNDTSDNGSHIYEGKCENAPDAETQRERRRNGNHRVQDDECINDTVHIYYDEDGEIYNIYGNAEDNL